MILNNRSNLLANSSIKMLLERIKAGYEFMRQSHVAELFLCDHANRVVEAVDLIGVIAAQNLDAVIKIVPSYRCPNR